MYVKKKKKNYEKANGKLGCHGEKTIQILLFYPRQTLNIDNKTAKTKVTWGFPIFRKEKLHWTLFLSSFYKFDF